MRWAESADKVVLLYFPPEGCGGRRFPNCWIPGLTVDQIDCGGDFTLIREGFSTVRAFGGNYYGQLGNGTNSDSFSPVTIGGLSGGNIIAIAAGHAHGAALKNDGTVWLWGNNQFGQLGDGSTTNRSTPVQVQW